MDLPSFPHPSPKLRPVLCDPARVPDDDPMLPDAPITPPLSPAHTDSVDMDDDLLSRRDGSPSRRPSHPALPASHNAARDAYMDEDEDGPVPPSPTPPVYPLRRLENEQEHIHSELKLSDFELKGTLGPPPPSLPASFSFPLISFRPGTGTFGRVLLVRSRPTNARRSNFFAMKVLRKTEVIRLRQVEHVKAERYILSRVRHPFIVDLYATFQDNLNIYMLLSFVPGGELFTHLRRTGRFTPDVTRFYLATIVLALRYLHSFNIIYRDLKPENLLLDARGYLRLTDFGFAKIVDDRTWTLCGTPEYLAPEIIQSDGHGKPADWWACGILAYEMMVGYPPFFDENAYGIYEKILRGKVHWPRDMDALSRDLVRGFLHPDRSKRLGNLINGPQDVLHHAWFRGVDWDALERREIRVRPSVPPSVLVRSFFSPVHQAPIVPHMTAVDDTRYFTRLPLPPAHEVPGLLGAETPPHAHQGFDVVGFQFTEF